MASRRRHPRPSVNPFIAIDQMQGESRASRFSREYLSPKGWIERYLEHPGVIRKPANVPFPTASEISELSPKELDRWDLLHHQYEIDRYLRRILKGEDPRKTFRLNKTLDRRSVHNFKRDQWILYHALLFVERGMTRAAAETAVAGHDSSIEPRTISRTTKKYPYWPKRGERETERHRLMRRQFLNAWNAALKLPARY